jgi:hypothetical protein
MKGIISISLAALAAGCASSQAPNSRVQVPEQLRPAANERLAFVVPAKGDQIYECREVAGKPGGAASYDWAFVAPEAVLFDVTGKKIGRHYAGPHWESDDGSKVVGAVKQRSDAQSAKDIPWLLLGTKSVGANGSFSGVTSIQRVSTVGGAAPAGGCPLAGYKIRVPYTADYYFFTAK